MHSVTKHLGTVILLTGCRLLSVTHGEAAQPSLGNFWVPWGHCQQGQTSVMLPFQSLHLHDRNVHASSRLPIRLILPLLQKSFWHFLVAVESSWWSPWLWGWWSSSSLTRWVFGKWHWDSFVYSVETHTDTHSLMLKLFLCRPVTTGGSCGHPHILITQPFFCNSQVILKLHRWMIMQRNTWEVGSFSLALFLFSNLCAHTHTQTHMFSEQPGNIRNIVLIEMVPMT